MEFLKNIFYRRLFNKACHLKHSLEIDVNIPLVNGVRQSNIFMIIKVVFGITIMCDSYTVSIQ